jgi:hypothetical protein
MACGQEMWIQARNSTNACPRPGITNCVECRSELCSSHIHECEVCRMFVCSDCIFEHYKEHDRITRELGCAA